MHPKESARTGPSLIRETLAGCIGALTVLPVVLTLGLLAFAPLGVAAPPMALLAAFITAGLGGLVHALASRTSMPVSGLSSATALTVAALVARLLADPQLQVATSAGLQGIAALCGLAVLLSGALQIGFAWLGLAGLARVVPQPVLAGFMNSVALLVVLAQVPLLLDLPLGTRPTLETLAMAHPAALLLGLGTALAIWLLPRFRPQWPAALLGLMAGAAVHAAWWALVDGPAGSVTNGLTNGVTTGVTNGTTNGASIGASVGATLGATIGALPSAWPWPPALLHLLGPTGMALLQAHLGPVALTALALAAIGTLESLLNVRAVDQVLNTRHDPRRELVALGASNMVCGLLGGLPLVASRIRALATLKAGGRGRVAVLVGPVALGGLYVLGGPLMALLPLPVLAGVMLVAAAGLADRWTGRMLARWWAGDRSRDVALGLAEVALVVATTLSLGMAAGVGLGVLLSLVGFATRMNRSLVHDRYPASARPSRRIYPAAVEARLQPLRAGIVVFELDGALFFGSSDRLLDEADALGRECRTLVLDMRRVNAIDETGAVALQQMQARARQRGVQLMLAGMAEGSVTAQALRNFGVVLPQWPDADRAIEAAEQRILRGLPERDGDGNSAGAGAGKGKGESDASANSSTNSSAIACAIASAHAAASADTGTVRAMAAVPLAESSLLAGLDAAQMALVATHLQSRHLVAGEVLFAEGDKADRLYVVSQGSVSILSNADKHGRTQRFLSISPGMMLGETAMLDGGGRTAGAVADAPTVVHALTLQTLDEIALTHPAVAIRLHRNVALHLSQRLRSATGAWRVTR
jgi:MFS superfamily sulfate permease-like transporter